MTVKVALGALGTVTTTMRSDVTKLVMSLIVEWRLEVVAESRWNEFVTVKEGSVRGVELDTLSIPDDLEGVRNGIVDKPGVEASPKEAEAELAVGEQKIVVVGKAGKGDVFLEEGSGEVEAVAAEAGIADTAE